jgi:hypothetical protein
MGNSPCIFPCVKGKTKEPMWQRGVDWFKCSLSKCVSRVHNRHPLLIQVWTLMSLDSCVKIWDVKGQIERSIQWKVLIGWKNQSCKSNILIQQVCLSVYLWRWASTGGLGMGKVQVHPQQVQASSGWMVRWRVLNHSGPMWFDGNWCLAS